MISRLLLGLGSFSNSMLYTFIFIFFTYQLIEPQLNTYYFFEICNHIIVLLEVLTNIKRI